MSFTNFTNFGFGERVGSAIMNGATESVASLSSIVRMVVVGMLSTATNTSLTDEEPCLVTLEEGRQAERVSRQLYYWGLRFLRRPRMRLLRFRRFRGSDERHSTNWILSFRPRACRRGR